MISAALSVNSRPAAASGFDSGEAARCSFIKSFRAAILRSSWPCSRHFGFLVGQAVRNGVCVEHRHCDASRVGPVYSEQIGNANELHKLAAWSPDGSIRAGGHWPAAAAT